MNATQKHAPDSVHRWGWVRLSGTGWCPLPPKGDASFVASGAWRPPAAGSECGARDQMIRAGLRRHAEGELSCEISTASHEAAPRKEERRQLPPRNPVCDRWRNTQALMGDRWRNP